MNVAKEVEFATVFCVPALGRRVGNSGGASWEMQKVRIDVLRQFEYYSTESNGHLSEYLPWYRRTPEEREKWISYSKWIHGPSLGSYEYIRKRSNEYPKLYPHYLDGTEELVSMKERSQEHASYIIQAQETGVPYCGHLNIGNQGFITNLPMMCAATCRSSMSVQELPVKGALTGDRELVKQAVLHHPLTRSVCSTRSPTMRNTPSAESSL